MTAPSIPNLNTLRGARGRGRGRGTGSIGPGQRGGVSEEQKDRIVQQTDQDASQSRMSAVALNYLDDPFASAFVPGEPPRRYPIINRGTFTRTTAIDQLVQKFLRHEPEKSKQIISLGAGSDTRFYRLSRQNLTSHLIYHELDFATNTSSKIQTIKDSRVILDAIKSALNNDIEISISSSGQTLVAGNYNLHPIDLRSLVESSDLPKLPNLSPTTPTLILSECCLCYLAPDATVSILKAISNTLIAPSTPLALILYEPIRPFDAFGQVMESNLAARGIHLQTLHRFSSLGAQRARLSQAGFTGGQHAADVNYIFNKWISDEEKSRIGRCEMMDEVEEWQLLAQHYCIAWGHRTGKSGSSAGDREDAAEDDPFGSAWAGIASQHDVDEQTDDRS